MNNKENTKPKSLYLYTAMIFIAALVMIIISFFGQSNLERANEAMRDKHTIKEKSEAIAESNVLLTEENIKLNNTITAKEQQISSLQTEIKEKDDKIKIHQDLSTAYAYYTNGDAKKAEETLNNINYDELEGDSKVLYTGIKEKNERIELHNVLMSAYIYYTNKDFDKTREILNTINYDDLDNGAKLLFTQISDDITNITNEVNEDTNNDIN